MNTINYTSRKNTNTPTFNKINENNKMIGLQKSSSFHQNDSFQIGSYFVTKTLGKGNFSVVKLALHLPTQMNVAVKIINKAKLTKETLEKAYREVSIMKQINHPNIVKLYQVIENKQWIFIVMEYVPKGEMFEYLTKLGRLKESVARVKFHQILLAVDYCHKRNIVHRDLKAENILLDANLNIKLVDFGFGSFYDNSAYLLTWCGSPPYAAPELFKGAPYIGPKADIWSLGVILYAMVCGRLPFDEPHNVTKLREQVLSGWIRFPYFLSYDCENLIRLILNRVPEKRPSIPQIISHDWMTGSTVNEMVKPASVGPPRGSNGKTPKFASFSQWRNNTLSGDSGFEEQFNIHSNGAVIDTQICYDGNEGLIHQNAEFNERVFRLMETYFGYRLQDILGELSNRIFGNLTATYLLLCDRIAHQIIDPLDESESINDSIYDNNNHNGDKTRSNQPVNREQRNLHPTTSSESINDESDIDSDIVSLSDALGLLTSSHYDNFPIVDNNNNDNIDNLSRTDFSTYASNHTPTESLGASFSSPSPPHYKTMKPSATMDTVPRYSPTVISPGRNHTTYISGNTKSFCFNNKLHYYSPQIPPTQIFFQSPPTNFTVTQESMLKSLPYHNNKGHALSSYENYHNNNIQLPTTLTNQIMNQSMLNPSQPIIISQSNNKSIRNATIYNQSNLSKYLGKESRQRTMSNNRADHYNSSSVQYGLDNVPHNQLKSILLSQEPIYMRINPKQLKSQTSNQNKTSNYQSIPYNQSRLPNSSDFIGQTRIL